MTHLCGSRSWWWAFHVQGAPAVNDSSNVSKAPLEAIRFLAQSMCHNKGVLGDRGEEIMDPLTYPSQYIDIHIDSLWKKHRHFKFCVFFSVYLRRNTSTRMTRNDCLRCARNWKHHIADGVSFSHGTNHPPMVCFFFDLPWSDRERCFIVFFCWVVDLERQNGDPGCKILRFCAKSTWQTSSFTEHFGLRWSVKK